MITKIFHKIFTLPERHRYAVDMRFFHMYSHDNRRIALAQKNFCVDKYFKIKLL